MSAFWMALADHIRLPQVFSATSFPHTGIQLSCGTTSFGLWVLTCVTFPSKDVVRGITAPSVNSLVSLSPDLYILQRAPPF